MKVIAEIGSNWLTHEHCMNSVRIAKKCDADIVKFQLFTGEELYGPGSTKSKGELPSAFLPDIAALAGQQKIEFMCTAFSPKGYLIVDQFVKRHKIASSEITALDILDQVNIFKKPVLLSTGGATYPEIHQALKRLGRCEVTIMYCVTDYPAKLVDFRHLEMLKEEFGAEYKYGYSDHSVDVLNIPRLAQAHGSVIIEKHVNLIEKLDETPDAPHSINARELELMIKNLSGNLSPVETMRPCPWKRIETKQGYFRPKAS